MQLVAQAGAVKQFLFVSAKTTEIQRKIKRLQHVSCLRKAPSLPLASTHAYTLSHQPPLPGGKAQLGRISSDVVDELDSNNLRNTRRDRSGDVGTCLPISTRARLQYKRNIIYTFSRIAIQTSSSIIQSGHKRCPPKITSNTQKIIITAAADDAIGLNTK